MKKFIVYLFFLNLSCGLFAQNANYEQAEKAKSNRLPWNSDQLTPFFTQGSDDFWFREVKEGEEKYYWFKKRSSKNKNKDSIREGMTKSKIKSSFFSILPYLKYNCLKQEW